MVVFTFVAGAIEGPGRGAMGVFLWGYTAWLMHKRDNQALVTLQKVWLSFTGIAGVALFLAFSDDWAGFERSVGLSAGAFFIVFGLSMAVSFSLLQYFKQQLELSKSPDAPQAAPLPKVNYATASSSSSEHIKKSDKLQPAGTPMTHASQEDSTETITDPYEQAGEEVLSGKVVAGMWARALVEGGGNDGAVKAAYVKLRVVQLEEKSRAQVEARAQAEQERRHQEKIEEEKKKVEEESRAQAALSVQNDKTLGDLEAKINKAKTAQRTETQRQARVKEPPNARETANKTTEAYLFVTCIIILIVGIAIFAGN